jgi:sterol desaturase/sphingolipid hydroxylase (fatty acid hydroxylase superfamily)
MPHEPSWNESDGQTFANIAHTILCKGTVQTLVIFSAVIGLTTYITSAEEPGYGIWPRGWPILIQVLMGIVIAEFGLYWAHRIAHEWKPLWRFHAVHHSVTRLWIVNTGRFHFVDSLKSIVLGIVILLVLGAPMEVITWLSAVTAFIGILTHCNIDMRFGVLSSIFNTPELHRWHHSRDLREGNKNYGENIMLWDHVFGTYFNTRDYRPPEDIGISEAMPPGFLQQLAWPFKPSSAENS